MIRLARVSALRLLASNVMAAAQSSFAEVETAGTALLYERQRLASLTRGMVNKRRRRVWSGEQNKYEAA
jgi:hypothetical protein